MEPVFHDLYVPPDVNNTQTVQHAHVMKFSVPAWCRCTLLRLLDARAAI